MLWFGWLGAACGGTVGDGSGPAQSESPQAAGQASNDTSMVDTNASSSSTDSNKAVGAEGSNTEADDDGTSTAAAEQAGPDAQGSVEASEEDSADGSGSTDGDEVSSSSEGSTSSADVEPSSDEGSSGATTDTAGAASVDVSSDDSGGTGGSPSVDTAEESSTGGTPDMGTDGMAEGGAMVEPTPTEPCDAPSEVFLVSCMGAPCHGANARGHIDLESPGVADRLLDVTSDCNSLSYVDSESPGDSFLLSKVSEAPACGQPMPLGEMGLDAEGYACLESWIASLAQ